MATLNLPQIPSHLLFLHEEVDINGVPYTAHKVITQAVYFYNELCSWLEDFHCNVSKCFVLGQRSQ